VKVVKVNVVKVKVRSVQVLFCIYL